jgi:UDP-glucose 4-epimerase
MSRKVLVTGGAGFIGSHVAEAYLSRGDRVWIVDDLSSGKEENLPPGAEFVQIDIAGGYVETLFRAVGGFDVVNHHAAQIDVRVSVNDPRRDAWINIDGFLNVLECSRRFGAGRFLFVSSGGVVYGEPQEIPTRETAAKLPLSPYGVSKLTAEHYLFAAHRLHGLDYVALRYANVFGPRQDPHGEAGVVAIFANRVLAGEPVTVFGDGLQTRDYVYVGDVAAANMLLSDVALPSPRALDDRAFHVGTALETNVLQLAAGVMEAGGREVAIEHRAARAGEVQRSSLNTMKLRALGWQPEVGVGEGLARTVGHIAASRADVIGGANA